MYLAKMLNVLVQVVPTPCWRILTSSPPSPAYTLRPSISKPAYLTEGPMAAERTR